MSFPYHDRNWVEAADHLVPRLKADDRVLAPDRFWWVLPCPVQRWVGSNLERIDDHDWVVCHKGELEWVPRAFLDDVRNRMSPVFANEVFVIFTTTERAETHVDPRSDHLKAFDAIVAALPPSPARDNPYEADAVQGVAAVIARFGDKSDAELREAENAFFRGGGYQYVTERDRVYRDEIQRHAARALGRWTGGRVLDVGTGSRPFGTVPTGTTVVRTDFSVDGVDRAAAADGSRADLLHLVCDAHDLPFADEAFDGVAITDSIEHVRDAALALAEAARVVRPGGELFVTYANTQSVNQVMMRKLGYPTFVTNHQHIREFSPAEMRDLLTEVGCEIVETAGVGLLPYWGIPGIDDVVRSFTDDDPEVVEMMRYLGEQGGDRHAYAGVALARKLG